MVTIKILYLLTSFYEECYLYKPFFSRDSNSEKYFVCKGFKYEPDSKDLQEMITKLESILQKTNTKLFINDIFLDLEIPRDFINLFKYINIQIVNTQQVMINKIITYIKGNNYFGEQNHEYKDQQIEANKWWVDKFFTDELKDHSALINDRIKYNESELNLFTSALL